MTNNGTKITVLICGCSGACQSMEKIDFSALGDRVRLEFGDDVEFVALHPRLCEEHRQRLMRHLLKKDTCYLIPAGLSKRQARLLKAGFDRAGVPMDEPHWIPIGMDMETTDSAFENIKEALQRVKEVS